MRVLFLTNFYLTRGGGGEEQSCRQVVEGLKQRGHMTLVLTSMHSTNNMPVEADGIYQSLYLISRKLARRLASIRPVLWSMEQIVKALEKQYPASKLLLSLSRYVMGGYIYQGYREGLREFGEVRVQE